MPDPGRVGFGYLPPGDAVALLTSITGRDPGPEADALTERLGHVAVAVELAAAFCRETGWTFARYQQGFEDRSRELLSRNPEARHRSDGRDIITVLTVWDASIEGATAEAEGAREVLDVLAYLAPDDIPRSLLTGDAVRTDEALAALDRYALVDLHRAPTGQVRTISAHRLVQRATRVNGTTGACATALDLLHAAFPIDPELPGTWPTCQLLAPHVIVATGHADRDDVDLATASRLLDRYGTYLQHSGSPREAPDQFERAVDLLQRLAPDDDPALLARRANLALAYLYAGRTTESIALSEEVLATDERLLGPRHHDTLHARANLALAYWSAERLTEAVALQEQVLEGREQLLGPRHPEAIRARGNLAACYWSVDRRSDARTLMARAAAESEEVLGADHPDAVTWRQQLEEWRQ